MKLPEVIQKMHLNEEKRRIVTNFSDLLLLYVLRNSTQLFAQNQKNNFPAFLLHLQIHRQEPNLSIRIRLCYCCEVVIIILSFSELNFLFAVLRPSLISLIGIEIRMMYFQIRV